MNAVDPNRRIADMIDGAVPTEDHPSCTDSKNLASKSHSQPQVSGDEDKDADETGRIIRELNEQFTFVVHGSKAVIFREQPDATPEDRVRVITLDAFRAVHLNKFQVYKAYVKNEKTGEIDVVSKKRGVAPLWLAHPDRKEAWGVEFFPDRDNAPGTPGYFNLWRGFSVKPDFETPKAARWKKYAIFRDHLLTNVADGDEANFRWIFAWFAQMVQRPRERIGTAIVFRGRIARERPRSGKCSGRYWRLIISLLTTPAI
jgi:hypothetical protein